MMVPIGEWVLREACRQAARQNRLRTGRALSVSVNELTDGNREPARVTTSPSR